MSSGFDQAGWLMDHTRPANEQRQRWENQGHSVLTEGQNNFNHGTAAPFSSASPTWSPNARDEDTIINVKTGRPQSGSRHASDALHVRPSQGSGAIPGTDPPGRWPTLTTRSTSLPKQLTGCSPITWAASCADWPQRARRGGSPAPASARSARSRRRTAWRAWRKAP